MLGDDEPRRFFGPAKDVGAAAGPTGQAPPRIGDPLTAEQAESLMGMVGVPQLPDAWKQGFFFAAYQPYGLQQVDGGPCGVIAAVQAFLLRSLLERSGGDSRAVLKVDERTRQEALVDALCEILWRNAGDSKKAIVLLPSSASAVPLNAASLRCLQPAVFSSYEQLQYHLGQRPYRDAFFSPSGCGVPLLMYSVVWTRGVDGIRERDVDDAKTGVMIGSYGYCTQELVNLMVFGRAYSNVFDGTKRLGSAKDGWYVMQGAPARAKVGFLSLFEAKNDCIEVGSRYKGPLSAVWIVCAESHYSVLFSTDPTVDPRDSDRPVELLYFDQFGRQDRELRLTVVPKALPGHLATGFEDGESIIDQCIRTKWKEANVDWNGAEKLL